MSNALAELVRTGEELREVFAAERRAISSLDHAAIAELAERKADLAGRLASLRPMVNTKDQTVRDLFALLQAEARATSLLATTANQAVRSMLGYAPANAYDRRARQMSASPGRVLARY
jgi:hypothetical protein